MTTEIDNEESKRFVIDQQNKLINFLYKEQASFVEELNGIRSDKETIFYKIAELYDKIEEGAETEYILEELANIQQYAK